MKLEWIATASPTVRGNKLFEKFDINKYNEKYITIPSLEFIQNHNISLSLITLLAMVPELHDQYIEGIDPEHDIIHQLQIRSEIVNKSISYSFEIGNGRNKPNQDQLIRDFKVDAVKEINGKYVVSVKAEDIANVMPTIYQDHRGNLWYVESPLEGLLLPEICLHFLIVSSLCNIMRYSPHEWNNILSNKVSSAFSLLISKYLRLFELKYPMLLTQQLTNFSPIITT